MEFRLVCFCLHTTLIITTEYVDTADSPASIPTSYACACRYHPTPPYPTTFYMTSSYPTSTTTTTTIFIREVVSADGRLLLLCSQLTTVPSRVTEGNRCNRVI